MKTAKIVWKGSYYSTDGRVPGVNLNHFEIYHPGDPCGYTRDGKYMLHYYEGGGCGSLRKSLHRNLAAAKRAAYRLLEIERGKAQ